MHFVNISGGVPNEIFIQFYKIPGRFARFYRFPVRFLVGGGVVVLAFVAMCKVLAPRFFKMLEDPGSKLSSCNFHALGSNYVSVAAAGSLWLPLKRLILSSIS